AALLDGYCALVLGRSTPDASRRELEALLGSSSNLRFHAYVCQLAAEAFGVLGHDDVAIDFVDRAAALALTDLDWLERCPARRGGGAHPRYADVHRVVRDRAEAIWREG